MKSRFKARVFQIMGHSIGGVIFSWEFFSKKSDTISNYAPAILLKKVGNHLRSSTPIFKEGW